MYVYMHIQSSSSYKFMDRILYSSKMDGGLTIVILSKWKSMWWKRF